MQERYLGDVHDYIKFALLRHLHKALKIRIGVNWYLTDPENNGDGRIRGFLERPPEWECLDKDLFDKLRPFREPTYRTLENFEQDEILPKNTLYYKCKVSTKDDRTKWHEHAVSALSQAQLIFLDQDNGFEVMRMNGKTHKYAIYSEAVEYYQRGKIVAGIQFAGRRNPKALGERIKCELARRTSCSEEVPVLQAHVTPNILFVTICPNKRIEEVSTALKSFAEKSPFFKWDREMKKDIKRVEFIP
ncbi:MAG: hypothetical protein ABR956_09525 [Terracidiphilus sp.]|jgi:hypothetical protein